MTQPASNVIALAVEPATATSHGGEWVLAGLLALAWTLVVRGPFLHIAAIDGDEALFLMIGRGWATGHPPYTLIWDLKPPGLYLIYAAVWRLFGDDLIGPKIASLAAVATTSLALYAFGARALRSRATGVVALILYAPTTLALGGLAGKPDLIMAPFIAWAAVAALAGGRDAQPDRTAVGAFVAGLLIGCAGMVKQTAVFEAAFLLVALAWAERGRGRRVAAYLAGCALIPMAFVLWFARQGLFAPLMQGAVISALQRVGGDGAMFAAGPLRFLAMLKPVIALVLGAALLWAERRRIEDPVARRGLGFVAGWALASTAGVLAMCATYGVYLQPLLPPLALLAAGFLVLTSWPRLKGREREATAAALAIAAALCPVLFVRNSPDLRLQQTRLPQQIGDFLRQKMLRPGETIYVVDYDPAVYLLAAAPPPTRYVLPMHLLCPFAGVGVRPPAEIARIMAGNPRCLVISANRARMACEDTALARLPERLGRGRYSPTRRFTDGIETIDVLCRPE